MTFPLVQGEQLARLAEFSFKSEHENKTYVVHPNKVSEIPNKDCTIHCPSHWLTECIDKIKQKPYKYKLISHNGDASVIEEKRRSFDYEFKGVPENITIWYAQNLDVEDPKIKALPIGFENDKWHSYKKSVMINSLNKTYVKNKLLYINHDIGTNPKDRISPYQLFKNKSWATLVHGKNGQGFQNYFNSLASHKFVLCPDGNGLDTHRIYEAIAVGTIPIVQNHVWSRQLIHHFNFSIVNDWSEVTEEKLEEYEWIINHSGGLNKKALYMDYWEEQLNDL